MGSSGRQSECVEALLNVEIGGHPVAMVATHTASQSRPAARNEFAGPGREGRVGWGPVHPIKRGEHPTSECACGRLGSDSTHSPSALPILCLPVPGGSLPTKGRWDHLLTEPLLTAWLCARH